MFNWRIIGFVFSMLTGVIFLFAGRFLWKLVHFITGFGLILTIFWIILYPAYGKKGLRIDWMLWICYPLTFIFSGLFGFFLTHFPRGGCVWIAGWAGYSVGANLIYDNTFAYIENSSMWVFWLITISCALLFVAIVWKIQKKDDKVFHLLWLTPIFGGYLCTLAFFILATNSPHTRDFAEIRAIYGKRFAAGPSY